MTKPQPAPPAPELLSWDPSDGTDEDEAGFEDELPADENFDDEAFDDEDEEFFDEEEVEDGEVVLEEVAADGYTGEKQAELPQPDRARSHPDLPKVKSTAFKRIIR